MWGLEKFVCVQERAGVVGMGIEGAAESLTSFDFAKPGDRNVSAI
jgi:hypothetical protein